MQTTSNESWLVDTNVLVYAQIGNAPFYAESSLVLKHCFEGKIHGVIAQQNVTEFVRVAISTYKLPVAEVKKTAADFIDGFCLRVITALPVTMKTFLELLPDKGTIDVFDYFLAATMLDNRVKTIVTANPKDFSQIHGMNVVDLKTFGGQGLLRLRSQ